VPLERVPTTSIVQPAAAQDALEHEASPVRETIEDR
jgi:hypothetical protein